MSVKVKLDFVPFDAAEYIDGEAGALAYLESAFETKDAAFIAEALGDVARARGMTKVAKAAGLSRESLYKALSSDGNPEFATILRVIDALGFTLAIRPGKG